MQYQLSCALGVFNFVSLDKAQFGKSITGGTLHRILGHRNGRPVVGKAI